MHRMLDVQVKHGALAPCNFYNNFFNLNFDFITSSRLLFGLLYNTTGRKQERQLKSSQLPNIQNLFLYWIYFVILEYKCVGCVCTHNVLGAALD